MQLPIPFLNEIRTLLGEDQATLLVDALELPAPVSIRLNADKPIKESTGDAVKWNPGGCYLPERPAFTFDPLLHAGAYYVQEASSMFVQVALDKALRGVNEAVRALDLCAAPGGKSTLLMAALPEGSLLVANEIVRTRANILSENLMKWGKPGVVVTNNEASAFNALEAVFDVVLTDVPCSGEGMFRKDPAAIQEWSPENVILCADRQRAIIEEIWPAIKPGGHLIYSTCTYNTRENEENIEWICNTFGAEPVALDLNPEWNITGALGKDTALPVYRFFPHKTRGEGFFLALLRKPDTDIVVFSKSRNKVRKGKASLPVPAGVRVLVKNPDSFEFYRDRSERIAAFPLEHFDFLQLLDQQLRIVHAGILMGEEKGRDFIPDTALALSVAFQNEAFPACAVDLKTAIDFLRKEAVVLPEDAPRGWVVIRYQNRPLGWVKNLGNRANNGYPAEWRIRSSNPF